MPFKIQRVPRGLNDLLSIFGGATPQELEERVRGTIDLLQFYGLTQLQTTIGTNAAAAEGAGTSPALPPRNWFLLFGVSANVVKTATVTALRADIALNRACDQALLLFTSGDLGPFGATETGTCSFGGRLDTPLLCPPGTTIACLMRIIGTDATAQITGFAEFAIVG